MDTVWDGKFMVVVCSKTQEVGVADKGSYICMTAQ
jgi:hypothetical protein